MDYVIGENIQSEMFLEHGVSHGVSTKHFGNMSYDRDHQHKAEKNIAEFLASLGLSLSDISLVKLPTKNSANVATIRKPEQKGRIILKENDELIIKEYREPEPEEPEKPEEPKCDKEKKLPGYDAGISKAKGTFLGILPADCSPIMFYDPITHCYALIHAGRAGVENGIILKTLWVLQTTFGIKPSSFLCYIGPHICHKCYRPDGKKPYDLTKKIILQLVMMGVEKIEKTRYCTYHHEDLFFSNSRAKGSKDEGRHLAIIGKK